MVSAAIVTGVANSAVCQPEPVSLVNVASAIFPPLALHRLPTWVPVLPGPL